MEKQTHNTEPRENTLCWYQGARAGLFIHWGIYAAAARHEWVQHYENIPPETYRERYFDTFNPDLFEPREWAAQAKRAGLRYVVIVTKHHDGFCLWDSRHTEYKATNTPWGQDLLRALVDAFRAEGLRIGLYYSLLDWHHPHFQLDAHYGPFRHEPETLARLNEGRDPARYARYMRDQITELLTGYGPIDLLWMDFSYPKADGSGKTAKEWESQALVETVRQVSPATLINDRLDLEDVADFHTSEQALASEPLKVKGKEVPWETCVTMRVDSWGYRPDEPVKSPRELIKLLVGSVSCNGNCLINTGPTARGEIPPDETRTLAGLGDWMRAHEQAVIGCGAPPAGISPINGVLMTYNAASRKLYLHVLEWPLRYLIVRGLPSEARRARFLHDGRELRLGFLNAAMETMHAKLVGQGAGIYCLLNIPNDAPDVLVPVIEVTLQ